MFDKNSYLNFLLKAEIIFEMCFKVIDLIYVNIYICEVLNFQVNLYKTNMFV